MPNVLKEDHNSVVIRAYHLIDSILWSMGKMIEGGYPNLRTPYRLNNGTSVASMVLSTQVGQRGAISQSLKDNPVGLTFTFNKVLPSRGDSILVIVKFSMSDC